MGSFLTSIQGYCCPTENKKVQTSLQINVEYNKCLNDYEYFFKQDWFGVQQRLNFDPDKFIFLYQNYQSDQEQMEKYWCKADVTNFRHGVLSRIKGQVLSPKWLYLIRKGVPCRHIRNIIQDLFKLKFNDSDAQYKAALQVAFKNKDVPKSFKNVPLFGQSMNFGDDEELEEILESEKRLQIILNCQVLNKNGLEALIRLLWVIKQQSCHLEYNPMILHIIVLLLIFLTEAETFCVIQFMIEDSQKSLLEVDQSSKNDLHWHLTLNLEQYEQMAQTFYDTITQHSKKFSSIYKKFKETHFNYIELFKDMTINLFFTYLPFGLIIKIFVMYLNEGIQIYYRMTYSAVRLLRHEILTSPYSNSYKAMIRTKLLNANQKQQDLLVKDAFKLRLSNAKEETKRLGSINTKQQPQYLPIPSEPSDLVESFHNYLQEFETIWEWIPDIYRLYDPYLIFNTARDGYSLSNLYKKCKEYEEQPLLLVIHSDQQTIFGAFCDSMLQLGQNKYLGSNDSFVFMLSPQLRKFGASGKNCDHLFCSSNYFLFGSGGEGAAFQLDADLNRGYTNRSETYNNYRFNYVLEAKGNNQFSCLQMEVYGLI